MKTTHARVSYRAQQQQRRRLRVQVCSVEVRGMQAVVHCNHEGICGRRQAEMRGECRLSRLAMIPPPV